MITNNRNNFTDSLFVLMTYPGDAAEYLTLKNSNTNETLSFIKPGDVILRESPMICFDGYTENGDAGYEGVRSFAFATTKITNSVVQYWLNKQSLYAPGAMKVAYGTFLSSLIMIKCHDMVADAAASKFNVIWARTTPIAVSVCDDAYDGYIVIKSVDNHLFLVIDPVTGIIRDVMVTNSTFSYGSWCYSDQQTEWASELAEKLNSTNLSIQPDWLKSTYEISMGAGLVALGTGVTAESAGTAAGTGTLIETGMLLTIAAYAMPITAGVVVACVIFEICVDQGWLPPERCREICGNAFLPFALINMFLYDEPTPTIQQLEEACWKAGHLLMAIDESDYEELYDLAKIDINDWRDCMGQKAEKDSKNKIGMPDPEDGDKASYIINLYKDAIKNIKEGAAECQAGNIKSGTAQFVWGVVEFHMASTYMYSAILPKELQEILPK